MTEKVYLKYQKNSGALQKLKKNPKNINEAIEVKLIKKTQISPDTYIYTYELKDDLTLGLNLGQHIAVQTLIKTKDEPDGEIISRKYTPISSIFEKGKFDLLIKTYHKNLHPDYPEGGIISQYLDTVKIGENIQIRGPFGKLTYIGDGDFEIIKSFKPFTLHKGNFTKIGMIAMGTGIAPMWQILLSAKNNKEIVETGLVFSNRFEKDILLKDEIEEMLKNQHFKFNVLLTLSKPDETWKGEKGRISKEMIIKVCPSPSKETMMLLCGSKDFNDKYITPMLVEIGYDMNNVFSY